MKIMEETLSLTDREGLTDPAPPLSAPPRRRVLLHMFIVTPGARSPL